MLKQFFIVFMANFLDYVHLYVNSLVIYFTSKPNLLHVVIDIFHINNNNSFQLCFHVTLVVNWCISRGYYSFVGNL
ncbi:unnamed protein product [Trichobilharzia regenti]|nr:unnamed protein product [Trichobilharzia regenti]